MNDKRLVLIVSNFPKLTETFIVSKFLGLLDRGWDIHIVCNKSEKKEWEKFPDLLSRPEIKNRVHVAWPHRPKWLAAFLLPFALLRLLIWNAKSTWRYLSKGFPLYGWDIFRRLYIDAELIILKPDCVHFELGSLAKERTYIRSLLGTKLTVSFRGYDLNFVGLEDPHYYDEVWESVDACHFLGADLWQRSLRRGCPKSMPHALIPPALEISNFPSIQLKNTGVLGTQRKPIRLLSVGRLAWKKGYEFSLLAVKMIVDEGFQCSYQIIGDGPYKNALFYSCQDLGLSDIVEFCGPLQHEQVIKHLKNTDIFIHSAVSEGFCNAVLEAQAMGVPVVCTDADGLPENIENNVTGFIVPRRDSKAMAEKIALLAQDGELRKKMGEAGRKRVETHFLMAQQIDAFEKLNENLCT